MSAVAIATHTAGTDRAAAQDPRAGMAPAQARPAVAEWTRRAAAATPATRAAAAQPPTSSSPCRQLLIVGLTRQGKAFRPSDWPERLAGALASFRPGSGRGGIGSFIGYSPYCVPRTVDAHKCVLVDEALRAIEPMAWDFVMHFARDNELEVRGVPMAAVAPQVPRP